MRTSLSWLALARPVALGLGLGLGLTAACSRDKPAPAAGSGSSSAAAPTAAAPGAAAPAAGSAAAAPTASGIGVFINDSQVAQIPPEQLVTWPRLDMLVPTEVRKIGTWDVVSLVGAGDKPAEVARPSSAYPDMVPAVFPGDGGAPAFGMFDPVELARKGKPAVRHDHLTAIRIKIAQSGNRGQNDDNSGAAADPTKLVITIKTPTGATELTGPKLLALPREPTPGNPDQKGWPLQALLDAAGVKTYQRLVLSDGAGTNLTIERKDITPTSVPFIKLNKQGSLRLRVLKKTGDGWNPGGDLRGLAAIEVK